MKSKLMGVVAALAPKVLFAVIPAAVLFGLGFGASAARADTTYKYVGSPYTIYFPTTDPAVVGTNMTGSVTFRSA